MVRLKTVLVHEDRIKYVLMDDSFIPNEIIVDKLPDSLSNVTIINNEAVYSNDVEQLKDIPLSVFERIIPTNPELNYTTLINILSNAKKIKVLYEDKFINFNELYLFQYENALGYKDERFISIINGKIYVKYDKLFIDGKPMEKPETVENDLEIDKITTLERIDAFTVFNRYFKYVQYDQLIRAVEPSYGAEFKNGTRTKGVVYLSYELEGTPKVVSGLADINEILDERIENAMIILIYKRLYYIYELATLKRKSTPSGDIVMEVM